MKVFQLLLACAVLVACQNKKMQKETVISGHPKHVELNAQYSDAEKSPLLPEDLKKFKSLKFFPVNDSFKVDATFELTPDAKPFEMPTSTDRLPIYRQYLQLHFQLNGIQEELAAYQNQAFINHPEYGNLLFIPFLDETNGVASYGGGRYLDIEIPAEGQEKIILDFNACYNPYCAYNDKYSCPRPPLVNVLDTEVEAGVKYGLLYK